MNRHLCVQFSVSPDFEVYSCSIAVIAQSTTLYRLDRLLYEGPSTLAMSASRAATVRHQFEQVIEAVGGVEAQPSTMALWGGPVGWSKGRVVKRGVDQFESD